MSLLRSSAVVSVFTLMSRVLGLVREIALARFLGTGPVADAFFVAFRFPNLFRRIFAEGAFNSAFVPLFGRRLEAEGREGAQVFSDEAFSFLFSVLLVLTLIAMAAMPWFVLAIAGGFRADPEKFDLTVLLTRITFPYLLFMSLTALLSGMLNSLGRFIVAAAAPILLNIVLIVAVIYGARYTQTPGHALAMGVAVAGVLQFLLVLWGVARQKMLPRLRWPRLTPGVKRLLTLGVPGVIAGGITQVNILVGTQIASFEPGAVSYLSFADRIYQLPLGLVGIPIGIVLLPYLARQIAADDRSGADDSQNRAVEYAMALTLPATAAILAIPLFIITTLYQGGAFTAEDSAKTAAALAVFGLGLPSFVLNKAFSPGFFAREDTKTPMIFAGISVAVNIAVSLVLFQYIGFLGVAFGTSIAGWVNALLLGIELVRRGHLTLDARLMGRLPRQIIASAGMGGALWYAGQQLAPALTGDLWDKLGALMLLVGLGVIVYAALALVIGAIRLSDLKDLRRRPA
ncbi:MAG: murein biosynthesis integral membrane protein MurJ [Pseudomonadota bacterium]